MRVIIFTILSLLCIPFFLLGFFAYVIPILLARGVVSGTAYEPFSNRYLYDLLGLREDPAAHALARGLPATNLVVRLCVFHLLALLCRVTRLIPPALDYPAKDLNDLKTMVAVRTKFIDNKMEDFLQKNCQLVVLGAGWDTRSYNLPLNSDIRIFEIDAPQTQSMKLQAIAKASLNTDMVTYIPCDFEKENWLALLKAQSTFDSTVPTFVIWEGVSMYLSEKAITQTLEKFKQLATGSEIVFDILPRHWWVETKSGRAAAKSIEVFYGEKFVFHADLTGDSDSLQSFLSNHELQMEDSIIQYIEKDSVPFYSLVQARN